ncbi:MAG: ABC transporter ATP-binding protein [Anaerovibrio sp.]|uniref:ABC transporter ATP-binding protein n=1 Tax=Anaerovibrio lipolyticus TaxID=82374 RepID=UPI001F4451C5|nr:ABC transporter ATP-binding protein [Anaerovibrio lipolyticus]MCF2600400.1 ABC transporter ATP-binding protein [Anaerovibrio lipolyticus]MDY5052244.1 ABC transporter ATP-binding protein [Anaerovibrio sp.]
MDKKDAIAIRLRDIKKIYKMGGQELAALNGINLDIKRGEFAALMGPSGSGKSTLMNILGCLDRPTVGSYELEGKEVAHLSDDELAVMRNKHIGFVFQNFNLLSRISSLENVALPLVYAGVGASERRKRAQEVLEAVGLGDRAEHLPNELSGGQRQRVAIARALVNNPEIIMADEPTGNLDTKSTKEIMEIFQEMHGRGKTIILVTHEPEIAVCANRQLLVRDGVITRDEGKGVVLDVV